jgi:hypothetical protein
MIISSRSSYSQFDILPNRHIRNRKSLRKFARAGDGNQIFIASWNKIKGCFAGSNLKYFAKNSHCRLSGWLLLSSQEQTKADAIPIFNAKWPGVRFFSIRLTRIQSPSVFTPSDNGLSCFCFLNLWLNFTRIERCAIPSRATLLRGEGESFAGTLKVHATGFAGHSSAKPKTRLLLFPLPKGRGSG